MVALPRRERDDIQQLLERLGICDEDSVEEFYPRVRDRDDIRVLRCKKSGVIFLSSHRHIDQSHYENHSGLSYWGAGSRGEALLVARNDDQRRAAQCEPVIRNKKWLDFGTGLGGILDLLHSSAAETWAIEPQKVIRGKLTEIGFNVKGDIEELNDAYFDVVTLFHVFEHVWPPIDIAKAIRKKMKPDGTMIVEVPHARDLLIDFLSVEAFKKFTFWSEHLILHTRESLERFLHEAGFTDITINGLQRYPLANHLYWLSRGGPGGHHHWSFLRSPELDSSYGTLLSKLDKTDTLFAVAKNAKTGGR